MVLWPGRKLVYLWDNDQFFLEKIEQSSICIFNEIT